MKKYELPKDQLSFIERMRQPFAVYQYIDKKVVTLALSVGFCRLFGYEDRARAYYDMDHNMYKDTHPDDVARVANAAVHFAAEGGMLDVIYRTRKKDSSGYIVLHLIGEHVYQEGVRLAHIWYTDEGEYIEGGGIGLNRALNNALHEESLVKANRYDHLTGLPNMSYFFERVEAEERKQEGNSERLAFLYIDLSGMKYYNQKYGFAEGDELLRSFGKLLSRFFHTQNSCHISADHFVVLTKEEGLEETLKSFFAEWNVSGGGKALPVHVGIYLSEEEALPAGSACDRAKVACDALKGSYSSCFNYYIRELNDSMVKRNYILDHFERALSEKWIQVYYQPIVRAISKRVCDNEALARWIDPVQGMLSPAEFIPCLEDAGLIYKLDLYVLDRVLENMKTQNEEDLYIVPHSINLSRSDFDACDIVEEIRNRVDASGIGRDKICIEITESMIGKDFDYMKGLVERFQALGFPVWMDDFGSGYSSLDVLQSIKFDLIKFDMNFMRKLDESSDGRIILTEMVKMALSLGIETVCEGVETEEQARFLQEIGCSKLQGYYFSRPVSFKDALSWHLQHRADGYENPAESSYYKSICSVNLYDLDSVTKDEDPSFQNTYNTLPMGIIEIKGETSRFLRSNQSYRNFLKRFFGFDLADLGPGFARFDAGFMKNVVNTCCERGVRALYYEKMPDGSVIHSFARRVSINPVTGNIAVAVAVLSISNPAEGESYGDIARALAADYYNIYVVDLDTDRFIEYSSPVGGQEMAMERHGDNFFEASNHNAHHIYEADLELFHASFSKEKIIQALNEQGVFTLTYRLVDTGKPEYVNMKIMRMPSSGNRIIIGISNIDSQMKQQEEFRKLRQERIALGRIAALSPNYIVLYIADPETGHYMQYNPSNEFESVGLASQGEDFFGDVVLDAPKAIAPEDIERHLRVFTKENILREIKNTGYFIHRYRLLINGNPVPVRLRATLIEENGRKLILLGVRKEEEVDYSCHLPSYYEQ